MSRYPAPKTLGISSGAFRALHPLQARNSILRLASLRRQIYGVSIRGLIGPGLLGEISTIRRSLPLVQKEVPDCDGSRSCAPFSPADHH
jgi:hypothetical protein